LHLVLLTRGALFRAQSLPPLMRSPSWPPMKIDVNDELKNVQRPRKLRKAIMVTALILINDLAIFIAASLLLREFLQINTSEAFGPGLSVVGHLSADSLEVTVDDAQNAIFRSQSDNSAVSVRAATQHTAKLVLGKTSSPDWAIANDEQDQFTVKKGDRSFLTMNGPTTTSTISTHVDMEANTVFGSPLIMSTGGPIPTHACESDSECGAVRTPSDPAARGRRGLNSPAVVWSAGAVQQLGCVFGGGCGGGHAAGAGE